MTDEELLIDLYYKKKNYDGVTELFKKSKIIHPQITRSFVSEWLKKQQSVQQNHVVVEKNVFKPIYSTTPYSFQIDLTFFPRFKKQNGDFYVLYTAININTRFAYAYFSKDKESKTILDMLKKQEEKTIINSITCDEGTEFKNHDFVDYCDKNEIQLYFVKNDGHKLGIINRFHRTLKDKLKAHFSATGKVNWINAIDEIINNYNHSVNRGIGMSPIKMNSFKEQALVEEKKEITDLIYSSEKIINIGDKVRVKKPKALFADKMTATYSNTIYEVVSIVCQMLDIEGDSKKWKVKKENVIVVSDVDNVKSDKAIKKVDKEHKIKLKIVKEEVDTNNIIKTSRRKVVAPNNIVGDIDTNNIVSGSRRKS